MRTIAVLLAAGSSQRFGEDKLWITLSDGPLWKRSYAALLQHPEIEGVGIVCPPNLIEEFQRLAPGALFVIAGGTTRTQSARLGFLARPDWAEAVLFHDAARPFVDQGSITRVIEGVRLKGAAFPSTPVTDTIKRVTGEAVETLERSSLVAVQTPQGARVELFERAFSTGAEATDDMALLESVGIAPVPVPGSAANVKVTVQSDLELMAVETRTGHGYDVHRFSNDPSRELWLGGVLFEGPGLEGHSDADAVLHAVVDSLLGAASLGDIGELFPNTDQRWKNEPSATFLKECKKLLATKGWSVVNIDISVIAERPRLSSRREDIRSVVAGLVEVSPDRVAVKATTNEGLGAIGRGEGVAAFAVATIKRFV